MPNRKPAPYLRQREKGRSDRAYTRIGGKKIWLGKWGSPESHKKHADLIKEMADQSAGRKTPPKSPSDDPTISELLVAFFEVHEEFAEDIASFKAVSRFLRQKAGSVPARDFGPKLLKAVREAMIDAGWARKHINRQIVRVRQIVSWGCSEEMLPATNLEALRTVRGLREGKSKARELPPVSPVPESDLAAAMDQLGPVVRDMVEIHRLIGCRPGELVAMKPVQIDRTGAIWIYEPKTHKNRWRGKDRKIAIGPRAQKVLIKYLFGEWCFVSQTDSGKPDRYRVASYRRCITRACERAKVPSWSPGRLRHNAATAIRSEMGIDAARAVLGHATVSSQR